MIIQCGTVSTCSNGLVIQARYLTGGNMLPIKKTKACYDSKLSLKDNALIVANCLQSANKQGIKQWQCNVLDYSDTVYFTQDVTINSVTFQASFKRFLCFILRCVLCFFGQVIQSVCFFNLISPNYLGLFFCFGYCAMVYCYI